MKTLRLTRRLFAVLGIFILLGAGGTRFRAQDKETSLPKSAAVRVSPFAFSKVKLLDSPFKQAMERNARYLLALDADRLLHNTRKYAGLEPKGKIYGGWEAKGIAGHTLGHYLTALAQQYAATGDARFRERLDYIVGEMAECQKLYGDGYIGALPPLELETLRGFKNGKVEFDGSFNFKGGAWVPWYTQHKILAGLKDAWVLGGNNAAKMVALRLADWIDDVTRGLSNEQLQKMLRVEHGGMSETLADLYALTGDAKYLSAARRFYHEAIMRPLAEGRDELAGKHANTQIPKVIGEARLFEVDGDPKDRTIAEYFWNRVVRHHSYVIGGNSEHEHFGQPDRLAKRTGQATAETCNTYNMLRLTRHLFGWQPRSEYFDFYERALYNHILASQEPRRGMFAYFMTMRAGHFKTYSTPEDSFWCCVGSGLENHSKYNDSIYFHTENELYVNLFIPSRLEWAEKGFVLEQRTAYPKSDRVEFVFTPRREVALNLKIRAPRWAAGAIKFRLNGKPVKAFVSAEGYAEINRAWRRGDRLEATIPMSVRTESMPDDPNKRAFLYGPLVLAGDLGAVAGGDEIFYAIDQWDNFRQPTAREVPVLVTASRDLTRFVQRANSRELLFRTVKLSSSSREITLRPFNEIFYNYYNVYWDVLTPGEFAARKAALKAEAERQARIDARTIDEYRPGEQQSEVDHAAAGEKTSVGEHQYRKLRHATGGGWFSFVAKIDPNAPVELSCSYWGGETGNRTFDILVDGAIIATQTLSRDKPDSFFDVTYKIPAELTRGKTKIEVRFQARPGNTAGGLYGARILKSL